MNDEHDYKTRREAHEAMGPRLEILREPNSDAFKKTPSQILQERETLAELPDHETFHYEPMETAFRDDALEYRGKVLEPFSHLRQTAAMNLGLRYWMLSQDDLREIRNPNPKEGEPETVQVYDGLIHDAAIVLWLCHQPDSVCQKARRQPRGFEDKIDAWADENGITVGSDSLAEATALFMALVNSANKTKGVPGTDKKAGQDASPKN